MGLIPKTINNPQRPGSNPSVFLIKFLYNPWVIIDFNFRLRYILSWKTNINLSKRDIMDSNPNMNDCTDSTQTITVELPCAMVERIMKLANENDTPLSNLLIEALDQFLRNQG